MKNIQIVAIKRHTFVFQQSSVYDMYTHALDPYFPTADMNMETPTEYG